MSSSTIARANERSSIGFIQVHFGVMQTFIDRQEGESCLEFMHDCEITLDDPS